MWFYKLIKIIAYIPLAIIYPTRIFNKKKLPKGKCILASNHLSGWDPIILTLRMNREIVYMAKASLFKNAFIRWAFNTFHFVKANRDGNDFAAIKQALKRLDEGHAFGLFPEGTRNADNLDKMLPFKNGASLFAIKSKSVVYPVVIKRKPRPFKMNYIFMGDPVTFDEFYGDRITSDTIEKATEKLSEKMNKIQEEFNEFLSNKYPKKFPKK